MIMDHKCDEDIREELGLKKSIKIIKNNSIEQNPS
jgi:hypothetical protein